MTAINYMVGEYDEKIDLKYPPFPEGIYPLRVSYWGEPKETKKHTGFYTPIIFEIREGQYAKRKIFENLNLKNESKLVEKIAENTKNAILLAAGFSLNQHISDTSELLDATLSIEITYPDGPDGNEKRKYIKTTEEYGDKAETLKEPLTSTDSPWDDF